MESEEIIIKDEIQEEAGYEDGIIRLNPELLSQNQDETEDIPDEFEEDVPVQQHCIVNDEPKEPQSDIFVKGETEIKHDIIDESDTSDDYYSVIIKEEKQDNEYSTDIEENIIPNRLNVTMESDEIIIKDKIQKESGCEDDIKRPNLELLSQNQDETEDIHDEFEEDVSIQERNNINRVPKLYSCLKCGFEGFHKDYREHLRNHSLNGDDHTNYTCSKCDLNFTTLQRYLLHFTDHGLKPMACPACFKILENASELISHVLVHIRKGINSKRIVGPNEKMKSRHHCKVCWAEINKTEFFQHWERHLELVDKNVEEINDEIEIDEDIINNYDESRLLKQEAIGKILKCLQSEVCIKNKKPECVICHQRFQRQTNCKRHLIEHLLTDALRHQTIETGLKCVICDARFETGDFYKQHMRDHAGLPVYKCEFCCKSFSDSSNYAKHKKIHNTNAYTCDTCGRKFNAKYSIEKHMEIHEVRKSIKCDLCDKIFHLPSKYKRHLKLYHLDELGRFSCRRCLSRFDSIQLKWEHMWKVHNERWHKADCSICPKKFRRKSDLRMHLKSDHGISSPYRYQKTLERKQRLDENAGYSEN